MKSNYVLRVSCILFSLVLTIPLLLSDSAAYEDVAAVSGINIVSSLPDTLLGLDRENNMREEAQAVTPRSVVPQWHAMKSRIEERYRFSFNLAYSALYQKSSDTFEGNLAGSIELREIYDYLNLSPPAPGLQDEAAGGIAEFSGKWFIKGRDRPNAGFIGFELEIRHRLGGETWSIPSVGVV